VILPLEDKLHGMGRNVSKSRFPAFTAGVSVETVLISLSAVCFRKINSSQHEHSCVDKNAKQILEHRAP
jgi:hypothetical protein